MSDVVTPTPMLTNDEESLAAIGSYSDALALLKSAGVDVHSTEEFGDGFRVLDNDEKATLVKVPFIILGMKFSEGDFGEFSIIHLVTEDGRKLILIDGSTGIHAQAQKYAAKGITAGLMVPRGLVRSDYEYEDSKGNKVPATTFYLS